MPDPSSSLSHARPAVRADTRVTKWGWGGEGGTRPRAQVPVGRKQGAKNPSQGGGGKL